MSIIHYYKPNSIYSEMDDFLGTSGVTLSFVRKKDYSLK